MNIICEFSSCFIIISLPGPIKRRVRALKKLQYETLKIDSEFYKELFALEVKYDVQHQQIFSKVRCFIFSHTL